MHLSQFTAINLQNSNFDNLGFSLSIHYIVLLKLKFRKTNHFLDHVPQKGT